MWVTSLEKHDSVLHDFRNSHATHLHTQATKQCAHVHAFHLMNGKVCENTSVNYETDATDAS